MNDTAQREAHERAAFEEWAWMLKLSVERLTEPRLSTVGDWRPSLIGHYKEKITFFAWHAWKVRAYSPSIPSIEDRLCKAVCAVCMQAGEDPERFTDWLCDGGLAQMALSYFGPPKTEAVPSKARQLAEQHKGRADDCGALARAVLDMPAMQSATYALQGGMSNSELLAAWDKKLPGVTPTAEQISAFAVGIEVGHTRAGDLLMGLAVIRELTDTQHSDFEETIDAVRTAFAVPPVANDKAPSVRAALEKLVELENQRIRLRMLHESGFGTNYDSYHKAVPEAWHAAREALAASPAAQQGGAA